MATVEPFALPPEEAIKWFEEKGYKFSFDWRDTWLEQHRWAFTVAKAMQLDLLADIRAAVDQALSEGVSFGEFQKQLRPILQQRGWWGEQEQTDPKTGETKTVQLGSARRLRTIYDTNMRQAHNAGQWQRIDRNKASRPYLRYVPRSGGNRRNEHQAKKDVVRPVDDAFWDVWMPMNGWGCKCTVQQLNERDLKRLGLEVSPDQEIEYTNWENKRTGTVERVPVGISPGFGYNPGKGRGFTPPDDLPPLADVQSFGDYGRPSAKDAPRTQAPKPFASAGQSGPTRTRLEDDFAKLFGVPRGYGGKAVDPLGAEVNFGHGLLDYITGKAEHRERWLPHAKDTVEDPYEIWLMPHRRRDGSVTIRKRYIGLFTDKSNKDMLVVVEDGGAFNVYPRSNIDGQRQGYLLHARDDEVQ
jgi:hypothetical protein